jgi:large subunit ribosomal protein L19
MKSQKFTRETIRDIGVKQVSIPAFEVGDTIIVSQRIKEGDKERLQLFQGDVIARHNNGASTTFTVRKLGANSVAVERIFPLYSEIIESVKIVRKGKVRRAKLYYLRDRVGRAARVAEKVLTREQKLRAAGNAEAEEVADVDSNVE